VFIHWDAADDQKIYDYNYQAVRESIQRALAGEPKIDDVIARARTAKHPFASNAESKHGDTFGAAGGRQMQGANM